MNVCCEAGIEQNADGWLVAYAIKDPRYRDCHHGGFQRREAEQGADSQYREGVDWLSAFAPLLMLPFVLVLKSWNIDRTMGIRA
jgi:hypothetical protein